MGSNKLLSSVSTFLRRHLPSGAEPSRLCVGLSGGLDSVTLLRLLCQLRKEMGFELSALHVHHGLSPNAEDWTTFCADLCRQLDVPLTIERVAVARDSGKGMEASARAVRYSAFARCDADYIVLAHHRDDQAETVLLNLLRGAGVHGAAAVPAARGLVAGGPRVLRPLLDTPRSAIAAWGEAQGLSWIEDESNGDTAYSRNFLRQRILPPLKARFPGCDAALARAARHFAEGAELLDALAELDLGRAAAGSGLSVAQLGELGEARARNLLRHWLRKLGAGMPDTESLTEALHQLLNAKAEATVCVKVDGRFTLRRYREVAYLVETVLQPEPVSWQGEAELPWAGGRLVFRCSFGEGISAARLATGEVLIRLRQGGDRLRPDPKRPSRSLKNLLQESAVRPWQREVLPCLCCGHQLVWVVGLGIQAEWQCGADEAGVLVDWL